METADSSLLRIDTSGYTVGRVERDRVWSDVYTTFSLEGQNCFAADLLLSLQCLYSIPILSYTYTKDVKIETLYDTSFFLSVYFAKNYFNLN